jgi:hypothetical protein
MVLSRSSLIGLPDFLTSMPWLIQGVLNLFVMESESDPAVACARSAIDSTEFRSDDRSTKLVIAALSYHNAQKIHNMLSGGGSDYLKVIVGSRWAVI